MSDFFDDLETRSADRRAADLAMALPAQVARARSKAPAYAELLAEVEPAGIRDRASLASLPVVRKDRLGAAQAATPPFGGFTTLPVSGFEHVFQSPGPIYEPGRTLSDWWRMGRCRTAFPTT